MPKPAAADAPTYSPTTPCAWNGEKQPALVTFAKAYSGLNDQEINQLDRWIRRNTMQRFGLVRSVKAEQVFEIGFEGIHASSRHKSASPCARGSCAGARTNPPMKPTRCKRRRHYCSDDNPQPIEAWFEAQGWTPLPFNAAAGRPIWRAKAG